MLPTLPRAQEKRGLGQDLTGCDPAKTVFAKVTNQLTLTSQNPLENALPHISFFVVKSAMSFWFINSNLKTTLIPDYEKFLPLNLVFLHSLHSLTQA